MSIPLSVLTSLIVLSALGQTINIMTLGGLALAVGILVDDATVAIENINRNLDQGKEIVQAILDGSQEIAMPALVSTLSICIVFVPMFFLSGVAKYLFVPLAEAVVFAMLASYLLSRTLVPTMARYLLLVRTEEERQERTEHSRNPLVRLQAKFEDGFERFRESYRRMLATSIRHQRLFLVCFLGGCVLSFALVPLVGQDFFPSVDSGEFSFHLRAPTGTRIEETAALCDRVENDIRSQIPPTELVTIIDNIGLPYSSINLVVQHFGADRDGRRRYSGGAGAATTTRPSSTFASCAPRLARDFPGVTLYDLPADIVSQILNFGLPAPIDIQIVGQRLARRTAVSPTIC